VVSLVPVTKLDRFLTQIKQKFSPYQSLDDAAFDKAVFATAPGCGAGGMSSFFARLESLADADEKFSRWHSNLSSGQCDSCFIQLYACSNTV
jgi:hypothetical protein